MGWIIALVVVVAIVIIVAMLAKAYNALVRLRNVVDEAWAHIETELQRRYDLIPNLVNTVKGYATHEKELLTEVTQAREQAQANQGSPASQAQSEQHLNSLLGQLMVRIEAYPDLKANTNFLELQTELSETENRLQAIRGQYNGSVRTYNDKVQMFPTNILAGMFGFKEREYFELQDESAREAPKVEF